MWHAGLDSIGEGTAERRGSLADVDTSAARWPPRGPLRRRTPDGERQPVPRWHGGDSLECAAAGQQLRGRWHEQRGGQPAEVYTTTDLSSGQRRERPGAGCPHGPVLDFHGVDG